MPLTFTRDGTRLVDTRDRTSPYTYSRTTSNTGTLTLTGNYVFGFPECLGQTKVELNFTSRFSGTGFIPPVSEEQEGCTGEFRIQGASVPSFEGQTINDLRFVENRTITNITLPSASGEDIPLMYSISPELPRGLSFDSSTRVLSGKPTAPHPRSRYTYTVTDVTDDKASLTFTVEVVADVKLGAPSAPRNLRAIPGDRQVSLQWREPASDGGSPIIRYDYQVDDRPWVSTGSTATSHVVRNLVNGTTYTFRVRAVNSVSEESPTSESVSASDSATPTAGEEVKEVVKDTVEAVTAATAANITANIGTRFSATPSSGSTVVVGGRTFSLGSGPTSSEFQEATGRKWDSLAKPGRLDETWSPGAGDLLRSSAFEIALKAADDGDEMSAAAAQWTVWGRGDLQFFESRPERGASYDGDLECRLSRHRRAARRSLARRGGGIEDECGGGLRHGRRRRSGKRKPGGHAGGRASLSALSWPTREASSGPFSARAGARSRTRPQAT